MRKVIWPISIVSFLLLLFVIGINFEFPMPFIYLLFGLSPFFIIWMVIRILKDGEHSGKTFDEDFYEY